MQNQKKKMRKRQNPPSRKGQSKTNRNSVKTTPTKRNGLKVPDALPTKNYREPSFSKLKQVVFRKKPEIKEIVREPTAGGIVFRPTADNKDIEILLIQDSKNRWTIPKGHIEPGETAKQTALREIGEESGLKEVEAISWLGKIHFKYRRAEKLVLMTTQVYLVQSLDKNERPIKEKWMNGIRWFTFSEALDEIEYADIEKLILIAKRKIRNGEFDGQK